MTVKAQSRDVIMRAAARIFRERGYGSATIRQIAQASGMTIGTLHYWFPSKDSLLLALTQRAVSRIADAIETSVAGFEHPLDRLRCALKTYLQQLLAREDDLFVLLYEFRPQDDAAWAAILEQRDSFDRLWHGLLLDAAEARMIRRDADLRLLRLFILGAINWVPQWYSTTGPMRAEAICEEFADLFARGAVDPHHIEAWSSPRQAADAMICQNGRTPP